MISGHLGEEAEEASPRRSRPRRRSRAAETVSKLSRESADAPVDVVTAELFGWSLVAV